MESEKIIFVLIIGLITFALLFIGILFFILQFKKNKLLHIEELLKTKLEIQDQTLTYVGRELHDNLGQLLTVSKIHINSLIKQYSDDKKMIALDQVLDKTVAELRGLSKSLNNSRINDFGLHKELVNEVDRIEKMKLMNISLRIKDNGTELRTDKAIILYRIIQEFLSNSLKYSNALELIIELRYEKELLFVEISDNGIGFDMNNSSLGSGVNNIKSRAQLLNAQTFQYTSLIGKGTRLALTINHR